MLRDTIKIVRETNSGRKGNLLNLTQGFNFERQDEK